MLRKFAEGLVFGAGFSIAMVVVALITAPGLVSKCSPSLRSAFDVQSSQVFGLDQEEEPFYMLPVAAQIDRASVIVLLRYEPTPDGRMKAVVQEILKQDVDATFHHSVGDEHHSSSYYPQEGTERGDGAILFFTGSRPLERLSVSFHGDRIHGLGGMPLELFRKKCTESTST